MPYSTFICLANSRKLGGRCIAGKDLTNKSWIRPVSSLKAGTLFPYQMEYRDGSMPACLDIIEVQTERSVPTFYQPENVLIAETQWVKRRIFSFDNLDSLCDENENILTIKGAADRIRLTYLRKSNISCSLALIAVDRLWIYKILTPWRKRQVRAQFVYTGTRYDLVVTDPIIENYDLEEDQMYEVVSEKSFLCISLGEPYVGDCYKLVAAILFSKSTHLYPVDC